jgi:hypothetical protein
MMKRRECLAGRVERSITGEHLITELNRLAADRGTYPAVLRCDNGSSTGRLHRSPKIRRPNCQRYQSYSRHGPHALSI